MPDTKTVGLIGGHEAAECLAVLHALARSCGLTVRRADQSESRELCGCIVVGPAGGSDGASAWPECSSFHVIPSGEASPATAVRFDSGPGAPTPYRGRTVEADCVVPGTPGKRIGETIATAGGRPVWTTVTLGNQRHDTSWVSAPWIKSGECVFDHLNGRRFMNLLPLLEWMRWISDWRQWQQPPLRACFMFDDPNLHAPRYGYVDFARLAAEGRREHYHTSFATVPLDGYYVNSKAARILRDNQETLSFLIHGNNHTYEELAGRQPPAEHLPLMRQAVHRIRRLEGKSGLAVSRVMAPPHGVCSAAMMGAMTKAGFEAVCVSHGSVRAGNLGADWTVSLGTLPVTIVAGLPVIPRFGMDRQPENHCLLAAYLNQPVIPVGHHWDLADGTEILTSAARFINGLGQVAWSDLTAIARSNCRVRLQGQVMQVQPLARITTITVPDDITDVEVEIPWLDFTGERIECRLASDGTIGPAPTNKATGSTFRVTPGSRVDIVLVRKPDGEEELRPLPRPPLRTIARKVLVELRDRAMPHLPRRFTR